jgi:hypothetical protein
MANLKRIAQVSDWRAYELETELLDPPVLRVRLRPLDPYDIADAVPLEGHLALGRVVLEGAVAAVVEWDLAEDGKPIPLEPGTKMAVLRPLMGEKVKGRDMFLGRAIFEDAQDRENFLGN